MNRVLTLQDTRDKFLAAGGSEPWITTPAEFNAAIREEYEKYGKIVKEIGAKVD
jgi:tripartite-type tricarboxylate transporter receptor subunit TctC